MNPAITGLLAALAILLPLSCTPTRLGVERGEIPVVQRESQAGFEDHTEEIVAHAEWLIEKNEREGAVLDERWYTFKRFGPYQELIFSASQIVFYGGLESEVRRELRDAYKAIVPVEDEQDVGDIRLFRGERERAPPDVVIIGQNGREVALKTIIRLIYLAKFASHERKTKNPTKFDSFNKSLKVFHSFVRPDEEFIRFFNRYAISHPDVVMIGFRGDIRSLLRGDGVPDSESYSDESLRVNWYPNAHGKRLLLVSIDGNRIYASRSGALIEAILKISGDKTPAITFLGSGGAIDEPELVGKIVAPAVVVNGDLPIRTENKGFLAHIVQNRALSGQAITTAHISVENVVVETTQWALQMKKHRVRTVDQELFHVVRAINSSPAAREINVFAGILITDNVSSDAETKHNPGLDRAEETIEKTSGARNEFFSAVLTKIGLLSQEKIRPTDGKAIAR